MIIIYEGSTNKCVATVNRATTFAHTCVELYDTDNLYTRLKSIINMSPLSHVYRRKRAMSC